MAIVEWSPRFETGIGAVDFEHRALIEQINRLADRMTRDASTEAVAEALGEIHASISSHFALEETIMRKHGYDEIDDHKADHERLLDAIRDIMDDCHVQSAAITTRTLADRLEQWFSGHFKTRDARLHRLVPHR